MRITLIFAALTVILVACAPIQMHVEPKAPAPEPAPADPCEDIACRNSTSCIGGQCVCDEGLKECGTACIPQESCCDESDCSADMTCSNHSCEDKPRCAFGETYDAENQSCDCAKDFRWCEDQAKCIESTGCCDIFDCNPSGSIDRRCVPTETGVILCLSEGSTKHCRQARTNWRNAFSLRNDYDIYITNAYEDGSVDLRVLRRAEESTVKDLAMGESAHVGNVTITHGTTETVGGTCKNKDTFRH